MSTANLDCTAAVQRIHEFLDGELDNDLRAAMERHLAGCADCSATLAQLRRIENAHHQLDAQLQMPLKHYWPALAPKVMERLKASERRRLLALPKLPRLRTSSKRAATVETPPTRDLLYLPSTVHAFLNGPAKYILPLAAVATFCFFMIRELREKPTAMLRTESAPMAERDELKEEPAVRTPTPIAETQEKKFATSPSEPATAPQAKISLQNSPLTTVGQAGAGGEQGAGVAAAPSLGAKTPPAISTKSGESLLGLASTARPVAVKMEQDSLRPAAAPESIALSQPTAASKKAKDEPTAEAEQAALTADKLQAEKRAEPVGAEEALTREDDARARSAQHYSRQPSTSGRVGVSPLQKRAVSAPDDFGFAETLQRAQQTTDLKKREQIWRDFLKTKPDSTYRSMAIFHLAETLVAASDSTTKLEQLEKNLAYFQEHAATLRPLMGVQQFDRELARLQTLVNRRKASPKP